MKQNYYLTLISIFALYAGHTMPLYFATFAMPTILRSESTPLSVIGLLGCLMLPWAGKFLWAPWLDRHYHTRWGKRRSWIITAQVAMVACLGLLYFITPSHQPITLFALLFLISCISGTQDIACGAYIIEQLRADKRAVGNYAQVMGTTVGSALGGAVILYFYEYIGWQLSVLVILLLAIVFLLALFFIREQAETTFVQREIPSLTNFWSRLDSRHLLYMCLIYRCCEGLIMGMQQPFLVDSHISVSTIGMIMGSGNLTIGLFAAGIAGILYKPLGGWRMLVILGCLRSFSYLGLYACAYFQIVDPAILFSIVILNMATRLMEMVTLYTIFMNHCSSQQAATDYSILVCGELIIYMIGLSLSGYIAEHIGYAGLFLLGSMISIPGVVISAHILRSVTMQAKQETMSDESGEPAVTTV